MESAAADGDYLLFVLFVFEVLYFGGGRDAFNLIGVGADAESAVCVVAPRVEHLHAGYAGGVGLTTGDHIYLFCAQFWDKRRDEDVSFRPKAQLALRTSTPTQNPTIRRHTHTMELATCYLSHLFHPLRNFDLQLLRRLLISFITKTQCTVRPHAPRINCI